jgi:hypothetical protein
MPTSHSRPAQPVHIARAAQQPSSSNTFSRQLTTSGKWALWAAAHPDLSWPASLDYAARAWRRDKTEESYLLVARLTWLGSRRGGDDNDAALSVLVLLDAGIRALAARLDDVCTVDDVRTTVWEEVKYAEPQLGRLSARYLLKRAQQRILRPGGGLAPGRGAATSLDALLENDHDAPAQAWGIGRGTTTTPRTGPGPGSTPLEDARHELDDLLTWARATGVVSGEDAELLSELVVACAVVPEHEAREHLASRRGVSAAAIRRRRAAAVRRLREAVPDYLAATA